jgi:hypothetical protein
MVRDYVYSGQLTKKKPAYNAGFFFALGVSPYGETPRSLPKANSQGQSAARIGPYLVLLVHSALRTLPERKRMMSAPS